MAYTKISSFTIIIFFNLGFQVEVDKFFIYFLGLMLVAIAASSSAFWVSAGVTVAGLANLLVALTYVVQMVRKKLSTFLVQNHLIV